jgi:hypothetical protein
MPRPTSVGLLERKEASQNHVRMGLGQGGGGEAFFMDEIGRFMEPHGLRSLARVAAYLRHFRWPKALFGPSEEIGF